MGKYDSFETFTNSRDAKREEEPEEWSPKKLGKVEIVLRTDTLAMAMDLVAAFHEATGEEASAEAGEALLGLLRRANLVGVGAKKV